MLFDNAFTIVQVINSSRGQFFKYAHTTVVLCSSFGGFALVFPSLFKGHQEQKPQ
jgi:hypothetical protein